MLASWVPAGPSPIFNGLTEKIQPNNAVNGAMHTVVAHPTDADIIYVGAVNGGVWKTEDATSLNPHWEPLTDDMPSNSIGALGMDPNDPDRLVAALGRYSAFGGRGGDMLGMMITEDGGDTWTMLDDPLLRGQTFSAVVVDGPYIMATANTGNVVTQSFSGLPLSSRGGLFRSTDGGATWSSLDLAPRDPLKPNERVAFDAHDIVADPSKAGRFYAALADIGIYVSNDYGATWRNISGPSGEVHRAITKFGFTNAEARGLNNNTELAVASNGRLYAGILEIGQLEMVAYADIRHGRYEWTVMDLPLTLEVGGVAVGLHPTQKPGSQGSIHFSLQVDPFDPNTIYIGGDRQDGDVLNFPTGNSIGALSFTGRLFRGDASVDPTRTTVVDDQTGLATQDIPSPQWEHLTHSNDVFGIPEGGTANRSAPHADSRDIAFDANGDLIEVDDGGIYRRTSPRDNTGIWLSMSGDIQVAEIHDVSYDNNTNTLIAGLQDNGTAMQLLSGQPEWEGLEQIEGFESGFPIFRGFGGDGGDVAVNDSSSDVESIRYSSNQFLSGFRRQVYDENNVLIEQDFINVPGGGAPFVAPVELNRVDQERLVVAMGDNIYESVDRGDTFTAVNGLGFPAVLNENAIVYGGRLDGADVPEILWVGVGGEVFVRTDALNDVLRLTPGQFPGTTINDIIVDPNNWRTAFVIDDTSVYRTTNAGRSWTDFTGNLAAFNPGELRTAEFIFDGANALVIGTARGVYYNNLTATSSGAWAKLGDDLPNVLIYDMDYDAEDDLLVVGTLGPGAFVLPNVSQEVVDVGVGSIAGFVFNDLDRNGIKGATEQGVANQRVYLDFNENGRRDFGETIVTTASDGSYTFSNLFAGAYSLRTVLTNEWVSFSPAASDSLNVVVSAGVDTLGVNFGVARADSTGTGGGGSGLITGTVFTDFDLDGVRDSIDRPIADAVVYIDLDANGVIGVGEPTGITDADGNFAIGGLGPGNYIVRLDRIPGNTQPVVVASNGRTITVRSNGTTSGTAVFGTEAMFDWGDAPVSYGTLAANDGAVHGFVAGFFLGDTIDPEDDGQPIGGDDTDGTDDEDGVVFLTGLHPGTRETLAVFASQLAVSPGYLQGWIDFNGDGDFADAGEQIFKDVRLSDGRNTLNFNVPSGAKEGATYARFRWGFEKGMSYKGAAFGGEVEDYAVTIPQEGDTGLSAQNDAFTVAEDSGTTILDVLANDALGPGGGTLTITGLATVNVGATIDIGSGGIEFTPNPDFNGTYTFVYTVEDGLGGRLDATVSVNVTAVNDPPTATNDTFSVGIDSVDNALDVLENDSVAPDAGETLAITQVGPTTNGGSVSIIGGGSSLRYTPPAGYAGPDSFVYTVTDSSGGTADATVNITVADLPDLVSFILTATDGSGVELTQIELNDTFELRVFVEDLRAIPQGVISAYLDVLYDSGLVQVDGPVIFNSAAFNFAQKAGMATVGLLDEAGAVAQTSAGANGNPVLLFRVPMRAINTGDAVFSSNESDLPVNAVTLQGSDQAIADTDISFGTVTLPIVNFGAQPDSFTLVEDTGPTVLDVLANDAGDQAPPTITSVTPPSQGGTLTIAGDGLSVTYQPAANFNGTETFTYSVSGVTGGPTSATVTVTVTPVNDDPTANNDTVSVDEGTQDNLLNVLANDTFAPDAGESLEIIAVGTPDQGGAVDIAPDGSSLVYTPAPGFIGNETFTYTISDNNGGTDQASVTVTVNALPDLVQYHLQLLDDQGNPLTGSITVGDTITLVVSTEDLRDDPKLVASAYLDVLYGGTGAVQIDAGSFTFNDVDYSRFQSVSTASPGVIDEAGAFSTSTTMVSAPAPVELFRVDFVATGAGDVDFTGDPADVLPLHETGLFGLTQAVPNDRIVFDSVTVTIDAAPVPATFTRVSNPLDVNGDGFVSPIDAIIVIGEMDAHGARVLPSVPVKTGIAPVSDDTLGNPLPKLPVDVNADHMLTALDVLLIINELDRLAAANATTNGTPANVEATSLTDVAVESGAAAQSTTMEVVSNGAGASGALQVAQSDTAGQAVSAFTTAPTVQRSGRQIVLPGQASFMARAFAQSANRTFVTWAPSAGSSRATESAVQKDRYVWRVVGQSADEAAGSDDLANWDNQWDDLAADVADAWRQGDA
ncbi:MAG: tandem-95 repeat protein [Planctomycetales bacterium]|nr:tandem-95 repeat protein [Planctomycetales bacterium]